MRGPAVHPNRVPDGQTFSHFVYKLSLNRRGDTAGAFPGRLFIPAAGMLRSSIPAIDIIPSSVYGPVTTCLQTDPFRHGIVVKDLLSAPLRPPGKPLCSKLHLPVDTFDGGPRYEEYLL